MLRVLLDVTHNTLQAREVHLRDEFVVFTARDQLGERGQEVVVIELGQVRETQVPAQSEQPTIDLLHHRPETGR